MHHARGRADDGAAEGLPESLGRVAASDRPDLAQFQCNGALAAAKFLSGRPADGSPAGAKANPRAIVFQLSEIKAHVATLPVREGSGHANPVRREALRLHTELAVCEPANATPEFLKGLATSITGLSDLIDIAYFR